MQLSTGLLNAALVAIKTSLTNCTIDIYAGGSKPISPNNPPLGTLVANCTLDGAAFVPGSPTNGLNFDVVLDQVLFKDVAETWKIKGLSGLVGTHTMTWFRIKGNAVDANGTSTTLFRADGTIGVGSGDMRVDSLSITANQLKTVDSCEISVL
jgi:hypothetical protein